MTNNTSTTIKWSSIALITISILLTMRALPMDQITQVLKQWTEHLGVWGPIVFAVVYTIAAVCLVPGSVLTLAAGAIFGLWIGFITVSFGSVTGAALAFLISRYVARSKIESRAKSNKKFGAIDEAIDEGGWKIIGLLRLSPAIPFNVQNYLFGLTKIRFRQYILTSWIAMIPGTFMYVYLGHAAGAAASGGGKSAGEWALLGVGLLATIAVTVYVTRLAKQKLNEKTDVSEPEPEQQEEEDTTEASPGKIYLLALTSVVLLTVSILAQFQTEAIASYLTQLNI